MLTTSTTKPKLTHQRSTGIARLAFKTRDSSTVLDDLFQQGSAKIKLSRKETDRLTEAVLINTSGGMTGGDHFETTVNWGESTTAIVTTQAAERLYRSIGGTAQISSHLHVDKSATALWLPQETIMFDGADYHRQTLVSLQNSSQFLGLETTIFGRTAMNETIKTGKLREQWKITRDGRLVFADTFALEGDIQKHLARSAIANNALAISTIVYVGDHAEEICKTARAIINKQSAIGNATTFDGLAIVKIFTTNGQHLRQTNIALLNTLLNQCTNNVNNSTLLPRVWNM